MKYMDAALTAEIKIANVSSFCRVNGINRRTFYRHKARIEAEGSWQPRSRRPGTSPGQTPAEVEAEIIRLRGELGADNGADSILPALAGVAAREGWAERGLRVPARSTVNRVLTRAGLVEARRPSQAAPVVLAAVRYDPGAASSSLRRDRSEPLLVEAAPPRRSSTC